MEFDRKTTVGLFGAIIAVGVGSLFATPMGETTILMMVLPSMIVFGLLTLFLGVKHGQYQATH